MIDARIRAELAEQGVRADWTAVYGDLYVEGPSTICHLKVFGTCRFGAFSYSDYGVDIYDADVGRYCSIGSGVKIGPGQHPTHFLTTHPITTDWSGRTSGLYQNITYEAFRATSCALPSGDDRSSRVIIGNDVWIGTNAVIMRGVTIGHGAVIGAGAVVTHDVEPFAIVGGVPARVIRNRFSPETASRILASQWWNLDLSTLEKRDFSQLDTLLSDIETHQPVAFNPGFIYISPEGSAILPKAGPELVGGHL